MPSDSQSIYHDETMGAGKPFPPMPDFSKDPYLVDFEGKDDPLHPLNWPMKKKVVNALIYSFTTAVIAMCSSIYSAVSEVMMEKFHVGVSVSGLGIALYMMGLAVGPCIWGPLSEYYGRKIPAVVSLFAFTCLSFGCATSETFYAMMLFRFFSGAAGSAPLSVAPGAIADMFSGISRGVASSAFALGVSGGPILAPIFGSYMTFSYLGWRWCFYLTGILSGFMLAMQVFFLHESFYPMVLVKKARRLRDRTGNWLIHAEHENADLDIHIMLSRYVVRPFRMLFTEPILFLMSLYQGFVYGLMYLSMTAIPIIFRDGYGWKGGNFSLPFLSLFLGCVISSVLGIIIFGRLYGKLLQKSGQAMLPEARLPQMMAGGISFSIGIFLICWPGAYPDKVHWIVPCVGGVFFGFGFLSVFTTVIVYVIECYLATAASAMAANTFMRSVMAASFPLFDTQMFRNLGTQWAGTLIGCLSLLLLPAPLLFYKYGSYIRSKSQFAYHQSKLNPPPSEATVETAVDDAKSV